MAKIPNWSLDNDQEYVNVENFTQWSHDSLPVEVIVEDVRDASGSEEGENWEAYAHITDEEFEYNHEDDISGDLHIGLFSNREDAEEEAREWMRNHPLEHLEYTEVPEDGRVSFSDATRFNQLNLDIRDGRAVSGTVVDSTGVYDFSILSNGRIRFDGGMPDDPPSENAIMRKIEEENIPYGR